MFVEQLVSTHCVFPSVLHKTSNSPHDSSFLWPRSRRQARQPSCVGPIGEVQPSHTIKLTWWSTFTAAEDLVFAFSTAATACRRQCPRRATKKKIVFLLSKTRKGAPGDPWYRAPRGAQEAQHPKAPEVDEDAAKGGDVADAAAAVPGDADTLVAAAAGVAVAVPANAPERVQRYRESQKVLYAAAAEKYEALLQERKSNFRNLVDAALQAALRAEWTGKAAKHPDFSKVVERVRAKCAECVCSRAGPLATPCRIDLVGLGTSTPRLQARPVRWPAPPPARPLTSFCPAPL